MNKTIKIIELLLLGFILPSSIVAFNLSKYILLMLWGVFIYTIFVYFFVYKKKLLIRNFFNVNWKKNKKYLIYLFTRWVLLSVILFFFTYFFFPEKLFIIQKNNEGLISKILLFYPLLSAFPQEFIFCTFFFLRYSNIFKKNRHMIIMSAIIFCFAHIFSLNFIAPLISIFGGYFFANTYNKTGSLLIVSLEHAFYGNTLFFLGLGWFFWGGSVGSSL